MEEVLKMSTKELERYRVLKGVINGEGDMIESCV